MKKVLDAQVYTKSALLAEPRASFKTQRELNMRTEYGMGANIYGFVTKDVGCWFIEGLCARRMWVRCVRYW